MDSQDKKSEQLPEYDKSVYVPEHIFHSYHNILEMMKKAQDEFHKVKDEMKPLENDGMKKTMKVEKMLSKRANLNRQ